MKPLAGTLSQAGSGSGGIIGSIVSGIGSLFGGGRATGGPVKAGVPYMVGENGGPRGRELFVPQQAGVIVPNHALKGNAPNTTVISAPRFDLSGAVITTELYADMQRISDASAVRASAAMGKQVIKAVPSRLSSYQRDGI